MKSAENAQFKRSLGLLDGIMLVIGSMIGSGIFIVSADIVRQVGASGWLMVVWLLAGIITMLAAVSYAELSAMFPKAGGQYVYLKESYNNLVAFLFGWSTFTVIQTGTIAAVGVAFAKFLAVLIPSVGEAHIVWELWGIKISAAQLVAILSIVVLTLINSKGVKNGKWIQLLFTITKILALVSLVIIGIYQAIGSDMWSQNWQHAFVAKQYQPATKLWINISGIALLGAITGAMVGSLFSSDAWNGVTFIAAELKKPERNVGLSLLIGTFLVMMLYVSINLMYVSVLPLTDIAHAPFDRVATLVSTTTFGEMGAVLIAILIIISTFGCNNGLILAGARVYYTMAKDGLFFKKAENLNQNQVPGWGLWIQCIWASILCLTGQYGALLDFVVIVVLIFYILTIYGVMILRKKMPDIARPYKTFAYPFTPIAYIILAGIVCVTLLITKTSTCGWGILILLLGIPVYYLRKKQFISKV